RGVRGRLPAQGEDRGGGRRGSAGTGDRRHPALGQQRQDRRRQDLRLRARTGDPHPHRGTGRRRAVTLQCSRDGSRTGATGVTSVTLTAPGRTRMAWVVFAFIAGVLVWVAIAFNRLVRLRNQVRTAWADIDVQLHRRHDLVPNLVAAVRAYAG